MKKDIVSLLRDAMHKKLQVDFRRSFDSGKTHGYILDMGPKFFLMALIDEGFRNDGYACIRLTDVRALRIPDPYWQFHQAARRKLGEKFPRKPKIKLNNVTDILLSANRLFPLVGIYRENKVRDACWIGRVIRICGSNVAFQEISPAATWYKDSSTYRLNQITQITFGGAYEGALYLVGGKYNHSKAR